MRTLLFLALLSVPSFSQDSTAWLEKNATLIFHEAFEREEDATSPKPLAMVGTAPPLIVCRR